MLARPLVLIGCGFTGQAVAALTDPSRADHAGYTPRWATTRQTKRQPELRALGLEPIVLSSEQPTPTEDQLRDAAVVISYPPDPAVDEALAPKLAASSAVVYVSSTAVYGASEGVIDDSSAVAPADARGHSRLRSENLFRAQGAVVLRAPGIYGPGRGLHRRLAKGTYRLTGEGKNTISRIHVADLAGLCLAALAHGQPGAAHVVGDLHPCPQREPVQYLCDRLQLPFPASQPADEAHPSLRGNRRVDPRPALAALNYTLRFPSYREGFVDALKQP